jgi:hypothetical protein
MNRIVAHFQDGRVLKGFTNDFLPAKAQFHITLEEQGAAAAPLEVHVPDLRPSSSSRVSRGTPSTSGATTPARPAPAASCGSCSTTAR